MITRLKIAGYKCFYEVEIALGSLTLFSGTNSSGKSSAIQPLLLVAQALRAQTELRVLPLNGELVRLGTASDVVREGHEPSIIEFSISTSGRSAPLDLRWGLKPGHRFLYRFATKDSNSFGYIEPAMIAETGLSNLVYIGAGRSSLSDYYPAIDSYSADGDVGANGVYAAYWYNEKADDEVAPKRRNPNEEATSFRKQVDAWMSSLFEGAQVNVAALSGSSVLSLRFRTSDTGEWKHPANVGYGYSYAFPIVVALLAAKEGQLLVVDSPEAHLHPFAQSKMGQMLAHFASTGVQVLVETHSDHLLNGCRLAVKSGMLSRESVRICFFLKGNDGNQVCDIEMDEDGRLSKWPEGFFDQIEADLAML